MYLLAEDMEHSGGRLSVAQCANVAKAEHKTDSDGSFRSGGSDDDGENGSDTNVDISEHEHDDNDVGDSGDDNAISSDLQAEMNTSGMYHSIIRALCCCVRVTVYAYSL